MNMMRADDDGFYSEEVPSSVAAVLASGVERTELCLHQSRGVSYPGQRSLFQNGR